MTHPDSGSSEGRPMRAKVALAEAVPAAARRVLVVATDNALADTLRQDRNDRQVVVIGPGQEWKEGTGPFDVIVLEDLLALPAVGAFLRRCREGLGRRGRLLALTDQALHHRPLTALLRGLSPSLGVSSPPTASSVLQLFLDAGFAPQVPQAVTDPCPAALLQAWTAVGAQLGLHPEPLTFLLNAAQLLVEAVPEPAPPPVEVPPLTVVVCVSDEVTLQTHLLRSPWLTEDHLHQVLCYAGCASAAEGLNRGLEQAQHELVVCVHQDVYLPQNWPQRLWHQYQLAQRLYGPLGVVGLYGTTCRGSVLARAGRVVDRVRLWHEPATLPGRVETLDELLLVVPRNTPLRFDPALGFHLYGADLCLQAAQRGLEVAAVDALCLHDSKTMTLPPEYQVSARRLATKWPDRVPIATSCGWIHHPSP